MPGPARRHNARVGASTRKAGSWEVDPGQTGLDWLSLPADVWSCILRQARRGGRQALRATCRSLRDAVRRAARSLVLRSSQQVAHVAATGLGAWSDAGLLRIGAPAIKEALRTRAAGLLPQLAASLGR